MLPIICGVSRKSRAILRRPPSTWRLTSNRVQFSRTPDYAALICPPRGGARRIAAFRYRLSTGCGRLILAGFSPAYVWIQSTRTTQIMNHFLAVVIAIVSVSVAPRSPGSLRSATPRAQTTWRSVRDGSGPFLPMRSVGRPIVCPLFPVLGYLGPATARAGLLPFGIRPVR